MCDLYCRKCGSMHHSTQSHDEVEAEERLDVPVWHVGEDGVKRFVKKITQEEARGICSIADMEFELIDGSFHVDQSFAYDLDDMTAEEVEKNRKYFGKAPTIMSGKIRTIANTIRIMAFSCKSLDVMSCEFGNEFGDRVEKYLNEQIKELNDET